MPLDNIETPAVLVDLDIVERNIARAEAHFASIGVAHRPHIKTHKIPRFAAAQVAAGATGITCQKVGEAEVMANGGLDDILITYNIMGDSKLKRLRALADRIKMAVTVDNAVVVEGLAQAFAGSSRPLKVLVECDTGVARCGVANADQALEIARQIEAADGLEFDGLMTFPVPGKPDAANAWLAAARDYLKAAGITCNRISSGGTPDMLTGADPTVITEWRAGTYIYNDRSLIAGGKCSESDCALTVLATVVSVPAPGRAVLDAGSKTLTTDPFGLEHFGVVRGRGDIVVTRLYEEHGIIDLPEGAAPFTVGERVRIIPNHCCAVSNMVDAVHLIRGDDYVGPEPVAARGKLT